MPEIFFNNKAKKQLSKLSIINKRVMEKINDEISVLSNYPAISNLWIKKLKGKYANSFCLKTKNYRIKFGFENNKIYIIDVKNRKDSYK